MRREIPLPKLFYYLLDNRKKFFVTGLKVLWDEFHGFLPCFDLEEKLSFSHFGILLGSKVVIENGRH
jgi:hypothetical protein